MPQDEQEHPSYIEHLVALYSVLLPFTEVDHQNKSQYISISFRPVKPDEELLKKLDALDDEKKAFYSQMPEDFYASLGTILLPKFFNMYKQNINKQFRIKCIGLIDKVLNVMPD